MKSWKEMSPAERVLELRPLFARGLMYREIGEILGTTSGAVAGFVYSHPEAKPSGITRLGKPYAVNPRDRFDHMLFGDGVASARIVVCLKEMKAPPAGPDGDGNRPAPANETRGGTGDDCSFGKSGERPPQGGESSTRELNDIGSEQVVTAGETAPNLTKAPEVASIARTVVNRSALGTSGPMHKTVSVALVPSITTPDPVERPRRHFKALAVVPPPALPAASAGKVSLLYTSDTRCRFPTWQNGVDAPAGDEPAFCGAFIAAGRVYCDEHRKLSYPPAAVRERATRRALE